MSELEVANALILLLEISGVFVFALTIVAVVEWRADRSDRRRDRALLRAVLRERAWREVSGRKVRP